jgi:hypothetical protein
MRPPRSRRKAGSKRRRPAPCSRGKRTGRRHRPDRSAAQTRAVRITRAVNQAAADLTSLTNWLNEEIRTPHQRYAKLAADLLGRLFAITRSLSQAMMGGSSRERAA